MDGPAAPERIAAAVRDELLDGAHPVGTRFREEDLAERFDVGRHTVRSALRLLVERGLVVHERHRGAVVAPLTKARINEVFDYRKVLELGALRMALDAGADLGPVLTEVDRLEALAERTPQPSWRELTGVHSAIHRRSSRPPATSACWTATATARTRCGCCSRSFGRTSTPRAWPRSTVDWSRSSGWAGKPRPTR